MGHSKTLGEQRQTERARQRLPSLPRLLRAVQPATCHQASLTNRALRLLTSLLTALPGKGRSPAAHHCPSVQSPSPAPSLGGLTACTPPQTAHLGGTSRAGHANPRRQAPAAACAGTCTPSQQLGGKMWRPILAWGDSLWAQAIGNTAASSLAGRVRRTGVQEQTCIAAALLPRCTLQQCRAWHRILAPLHAGRKAPPERAGPNSPVGISRQPRHRCAVLHLKAHMYPLAQPPLLLPCSLRASCRALPHHHVAVAGGADQEHAAGAQAKSGYGSDRRGVTLRQEGALLTLLRWSVAEKTCRARRHGFKVGQLAQPTLLLQPASEWSMQRLAANSSLRPLAGMLLVMMNQYPDCSPPAELVASKARAPTQTIATSALCCQLRLRPTAQGRCWQAGRRRGWQSGQGEPRTRS